MSKDELKERILKGVRASKFAFSVPGPEIKRYFTRGTLNQWALENTLAYDHELTTDEFLFGISPSLAAMKGAREGMKAAADILDKASND